MNAPVDDQTLEHWAEVISRHAPFVLLGMLGCVLVTTWTGWRLFEMSWGWLKRSYPSGVSLSPLVYLAIHLGIGLSLALVGFHGFREVAETLARPDRMAVFDVALARQLHINASFLGLWTFRAIAWLGGFPMMAGLLILVSAFLISRREWLRAAGWIAALVGNGVLNTTLKASYQRVRPSAGWTNPFVTEPGWSFPSGHAMGSIVAYGMLAYLLISHERTGQPARRLGIVAGAIGIVLMIGFSRIYLTVHYFSDVAGGFAAGAAWLAICVTGLELACRRQTRRTARQKVSQIPA